MGHCKTCKAPHEMPPGGRNRFEALYGEVVQQLQFQNLRKIAKQYFQSPDVKGWMRFKRSKSAETMRSMAQKDPRHGSPQHSVNLECQAFPKYWNQNVVRVGSRIEFRNLLDLSRRQERASEVGSKSANSSHRKVEHEPGHSRRSEPPPRTSPSSSEIGRFRKSVETTNTTTRRASRAKTTVGCETLAIPIPRRSSSTKPHSQPPTPIETEHSSECFHVRNLQYTDEGGPSPPINKLETRPASMTLRRQFNCNSLMDGVKSQRALDAKLESCRKREPGLNAQAVNAPVAIVIFRSENQPSAVNRNMNEIRTKALRNENRTRYSEAPTGDYLRGKEFGLERDVDCNGKTTRASNQQSGSERPTSRAMLDSTLARKCRPLATTASRTTAILQDALEALECAHRWNEWGARTLHELARASKAAAERNHNLLLGWSTLNKRNRKDHHFQSNPKPQLILLPHDNDVVVSTTSRGRVLESREEEREFIRDLLVASGITNGDYTHLLHAKRQHVVTRSKKKRVEKRILHDFVEELLRHELELRKGAEAGINLIHEPVVERKGQALVQRVWNHLQICPSPASDDIFTTLQSILQRDLKSQGCSAGVERAEVMEELEKMIHEDLMDELLEELTIVKSK